MTPTMNLRPTPGTAELLEVLDRTLSGGIVIDRALEPVELASHATEGRILVAVETYLGHGDTDPIGLLL